MKKILKNHLLAGTFALATLLTGCAGGQQTAQPTLKSALKGKFYIGAALNEEQITGRDTAGNRVLQQQFDAIVAENNMKSVMIHPEEDRYDFAVSDLFVALGERNNMWITGHCLIWHSQLSPWFCIDEKGNNVSPEVLKQRMKDHIHTIVGRYKGRIKGWDVVNEAILDDGAWRQSKFYEILGDEFMELAFQYAHEADPEAELYYNDYNEWHVGKRDAIVAMVRKFKEKGIRIDGIGMQGHIGMEDPSLKEYEDAILAYAAEGMKVMVTELDMSILPSPRRNVGADVATSFEYQNEINPYTQGVPEEKMQEWTRKFGAYFDLFLKHQDKITRVTLWGISDKDSWKNGFPVRGRTDYPLLFDRDYQPKPIVDYIIDAATKAQ